MNVASTLRRNPGPSWGYNFLLWADRSWPRWFFRPLLKAGTWVALGCMPVQRAFSRAYLAVVFGRPPRAIEVWRHFFAFTHSMMLQLRACRGVPLHGVLAPENEAAFEALLHSGRPALFGSFHCGDSDLLGYLLSERGRRVSIIRLRVGNSVDTRLLGQQYGQVSFLWINDPSQLLFELKTAIETGDSLALKCDRLEFSAKVEPFQFLGAQRLFPFTIYHLALLFDRPVVFCIAVADDPPLRERPSNAIRLRILSSPVFTPDPAASREANTQAARAHFQAVLIQLETLLRQNPFLWFNFLPLNPTISALPTDRKVSPNG